MDGAVLVFVGRLHAWPRGALLFAPSPPETWWRVLKGRQRNVHLLHLESQGATMERLPGKGCATCCTIFSIFCILILVVPLPALLLTLRFVIRLFFDMQVACGLLLKNKNPYIAGHSFVEVRCDFTRCRT